jgi:cytoskeletal protein RodZ
MPFDLCRIGELLRQTREEKGLSFEEVSEVLFIRKRVIGAIESGDWGNLPHPVYVKGYVNQYAALLNIADRLEAQLIATEKEPPQDVQVAQLAPKKAGVPKGWGAKKKLAAASVMGAVVVGFLIFQNMPKTAYVAPSVQTVASSYPAVHTETDVQPVEVSAKSVLLQSAPVAAEEGEKVVLEPKKLTIACQEKTWVRIIIDGLEQKEFTLNPEEVVMLDAKENFDVLIGNAGGVKLFYNGKDTGFTGEYGEVKHISLS